MLRKMTVPILMLLVAMMACGAPSSSSSPDTPVPPTATEEPTAMPTATPTVTPMPSPAVTGTLIDVETNDPLVGAYVFLCEITEWRQCTINLELSALTDEEGVFDIPVSPGEYAFFYNTSGVENPDLDGLEIDYRTRQDELGIETSILAELMLDFSNGLSIPGEDLGGCFLEFFGDDGLYLSMYLYYRPKDVGIVMYMDELISVEVTDGPAELNLAVWDLEGEDPNCEDFNPYR